MTEYGRYAGARVDPMPERFEHEHECPSKRGIVLDEQDLQPT